MMNFKSLLNKHKHRRIYPKIILIIIMTFCFPVFLNPSNSINAKNKFCNIYIVNQENHKIKLRVEIADTDSTRSRGLMFRENLEQNSGMFFVFDNETALNFWMKNTYIPLDIAYINRDGIINEIYLMKPLDISVTYPSKKPAMFALEVNDGWFKKNHITTGSKIILNGCIGK